jgi:hypothetical protein
MSTLLATEIPDSPHLVSDVVAAQFSIPEAFSNLTLQIDTLSFQNTFVLPLVEISPVWHEGKVVLKIAIDEHSRLAFTLLGEFHGVAAPFTIRQLTLSLDKDSRLASSEFMTVSMWAVLALAEEIHLRMRGQEMDLTFGFDAPLLEISEMLRRRQIAYRVLVIEKATGLHFDLPIEISGEEVEELTLIYHAIVERSFDWPIDKITVFFPATEKWQQQLQSANGQSSFTLGPDPVYKTLFGKELYLGEGTITLLDKSIENLDKVEIELSANDGHEVPVVIRSQTGHGRYQFPMAPRLPNSPWPENIQRLVNLDEQFDSKLFKRYNELAAATLAGLSEDQKIAITARSRIGEAFVIDPSTAESV